MTPNAETTQPTVTRLVRELPDLLRQHRIPGLSIGICTSEEIVWTAGFGTIDLNSEIPVTSRTRFGVQSCSKMFTASIAMALVEDGVVTLDEPITTYLPDFRVGSRFEARPERKITLRHLLSHTAGFTHEAPVGSNYAVGRASFDAHCESIGQTWLRFPVGHHYEYSNLGIDLAGYLLQRVTGIPFPHLAAKCVFEPLALDRTSFDLRVIKADRDRARGHGRGGRNVPTTVPMLAAGGLYTTVDDACRYLQFHLGGGATQQMYPIPFAPDDQPYGYGLGIVTMEHNGVLVRGHSGGGFGFLSDMYWAPHDDLGVVVLTNSVDHPLQWSLVADIFSELITPRPIPKPALPEPVVDLNCRISGTYVGRGNDVAVVELDDKDRSRGSCTFNGIRHDIRITGRREFAELSANQQYRILDDKYLQRCSDGHTLYRNDVPAHDHNVPAPDGLWNRTYVTRAQGVPITHCTLVRKSGLFLAICTDVGATTSITLRLYEHGDGLFFTSTGEALDVTRTPPTLANVPLSPAGSQRRPHPVDGQRTSRSRSLTSG